MQKSIKRLTAMGFIVLTIFVSSIIWSSVQRDFKNVEMQQYVVGSGDTVWSIASLSDLKDDKRAIVSYMLDYNDIKNGSIHPGDVVYYPVIKK